MIVKDSPNRLSEELIMDNEQWRDEFAAWLENFPWQWFCSLTFRPGFSQSQARWRLRKWVGMLRSELGTTNFGFVAVPEFGTTLLNFHFHLLMVGLRQWRTPERLEWMRRWHKLAGNALITEFKPCVGGIRYVLKTIGPDDMDDIEFDLTSSTATQTQFGAK
jgi:hypothetical protein